MAARRAEQAEEEPCWEETLPAIERARSSRSDGKVELRVSAIVEEVKQGQGKDVSEEGVAQALREAVVVTIAQGSGYSTDKATGEVVYLLPGPNARANVVAGLRARSWKHNLRFAWEERVFPMGLYLVKITIGAFLVISLCILALALIALLAASKNRGSGGSFTASSHRHFGRFWCPVRVWFWPWHVQAGGGGVAAAATGATVHRPDATMSFAEAVFSFIFGDGPPENVEESHFAFLRNFVASKKGQPIRAHEFVPYLREPMPLPPRDATELVPNTQFMAPILAKLRGNPVASDDGNLAYIFPKVRSASTSTSTKCFRERKYVFSLAPPDQQKLAIGLGVANFVCLLLVWSQIANEERLYTASIRGGIVFGGAVRVVQWIFPLLVFYAVSFLLIPGLRWQYIKRVNRHIDSRNEERELWARRIAGESFV